MNPSFDLVVIGSGPGGYVAAIRAAQLKMKVALIESDQLGGICLNWGCIPTKALLKSAEVLETARHAATFGIGLSEPTIDFEAIIRRSRQVSQKLNLGIRSLLKKNGVTVFEGRGRLDGPGKVQVTGKENAITTLETKEIILATGAKPRSLPGMPIDRKKIITSREAMTLPTLPKRLIILGAGAIGVEFAYFYSVLGTEVTLVEYLPHILPIEDDEVALRLEQSFKKRGIQVYSGHKAESADLSGDGVKVTVSSVATGEKTVLEGDLILMAVGLEGNTSDLGLETVGVAVERSFIKVDDQYATTTPHILAIGDVAGPPLLAHVASHEAIVAVETLAGLHPHPIDYDAIPGCTYCKPQVASLGLTERACREKNLAIKIGKFPFMALGKARAIEETDGFVKLIFDEKEGTLLGAHLIGPEATELLGELCLAKRMKATSAAIQETMHAHPTLSEALMEAAAIANGTAIHV